MKYNSDEFVPNYVLDRAVSKLLYYGYDGFDHFCDEADISFVDRNRCIAKARIAHGRDDLKERPYPDNLKDERFRTYKSWYGTKKAMEILKAIDATDQFNPTLTAEQRKGL